MKRSISFLLSTFLATAPALADDNAKPTAPPADPGDDDTAPPPDDQPDAPIGPRNPDVRGPDVRGPDVRGPDRRDPGDVRGPVGPRAGRGDRANRPRLGVAVSALDAAQASRLGVPAGRGAIVDSVQPGSAAERAGMRAGDVIIDVDGDVTREGQDIVRALADRRRGDVVTITVVRAGRGMALRATLDSNADRFDVRRGGGRFGGGAGRPDQFRDGPETARLRRELDEARRRIEELERRLERLERPRT